MRHIIDLDRYPLDREGSKDWHDMVAAAQAALQQGGMFSLEGFLRPGVAAQAAAEIAPVMASDSLPTSITKIRSGVPPISRIPPSEACNLPCSRSMFRRSFLVRPSAPPAKISSSAFRRAIEFWMVFQLVSVPPNQRWFM